MKVGWRLNVLTKPLFRNSITGRLRPLHRPARTLIGLRELGIDTDLNTVLSFAGGLTLRLLAIWGGWKLPTFSYQQRWD
jgi:hypothetical protein